MQKIDKLSTVDTHTWLYMQFNEDITEHLGTIVPYPQKHFIQDDGSFVYAWLLLGFFDNASATRKTRNLLSDIIARFMLTFDCRHLKSFKTKENKSNGLSPYRLKKFYKLKDKVKKQKEYYKADTQFDSIFWVLKYYSEDLIREDGFIIHDKLLEYALDNFKSTAKDTSTLKAKCRNIFYWYEARNWQIGRENRKYETKEQWVASRSNHMKKLNRTRIEDTKRKIQNCINGLYKNEYKKPNGKWNIVKICNDTGLHRNTVSNYLKERE